jgi:hypothetical protein
MKSFQVLNVIPPAEQGNYDDLQAMRSAAGWYLGTMYVSRSGNASPGSRDTNYFRSSEDATLALTELEKVETELHYLHLENRLSEWGDRCSRILGYDVYYRMEP